MHPFFAPLTEFELGVLLTGLTVGGPEAGEAFGHLAPEAAARVREKAQALQAIAADKRVPLMVRELKDALTQGGARGVERLDPSWIVAGLRGESPRTVGVVLLGLPLALTRSVLRRLPPPIRQALPPRHALTQVQPAVREGVRRAFEARFAPMPRPTPGPVAFADLVHLDRADLFRLTRDLGLIELAQAFTTVGRMALVELCRRLPRQHAEELIQAVRVASRVDLPDPKRAQHFLSKVVVNFENSEEFLQKSGLWRLARASLSCEPAAQKALVQRLPRRAGMLLETYIARVAEEDPQGGPEVTQRLQDSILVRVVLLSRSGAIAPTWAQTTMAYADPAAAQAALEAPQLALGEEAGDGPWPELAPGPPEGGPSGSGGEGGGPPA